MSKKIKEKTAPIPMSRSEFIEWCRKSPQRHVILIGEYADTIKVELKTKEQWDVFIKRNVRAARDLSVFDDDQISDALHKIMEQQKWLSKYTLETILKFLT
jgi:hypothetical protein